MIEKKIGEKKHFVLKYILQAMLSLLVIIGAFFLFKILYFDHNPEYWIDMFYGNRLAVYLIYMGSEVFFGLFPPEIFMFWAINAGAGSIFSYVLNIVFFAAVSMAAGHLTYWFGRYLARKYGKRIRKQKKIAEYLPMVRKFGGIIILISAMTPLPWATISMIMGVIAYKYKYYTLFALARILRFAINGFLIFQTGSYFF
jgi:membrane protein DedA with SNARE-associated domain